jgi:hypothetical protein
MQTEKSKMKTGLGDSKMPTPTLVTMVSNYSSYNTQVSTTGTLGTFGLGLDETLQGSTTCKDITGKTVACPSCTHQGTDTTVLAATNPTWVTYPNLTNGQLIRSVSAGNDGTLVAFTTSGQVPYVFKGQGWSSLGLLPNGWQITNLSVATATNAVAVIGYNISQRPSGRDIAYPPPNHWTSAQYSPSTGAVTFITPPVASTTNIVKVQQWNANTNGTIDFRALDSTNTAWVYVNNGTAMVWAQVQGTVYDIGGGTAIGPANSNGNVYQIVATGVYWNPVFVLNQYTGGPTLISLHDGGSLGTDSAGKIWVNSNNLGKPWTPWAVTTPITPTHIVADSASYWVADGANNLVRYLPSVTGISQSGLVGPATYINQTGGLMLYNALPGSPLDFSFTGSSGLNCSCIGSLFSSAKYTTQEHPTYTQAKWLGTSLNCVTSQVTGLTTCAFPVKNWCTAATTPPDFDMTGQNVGDLLLSPPYQFWDIFSGCYRVGTSGPWSCFHSFISFGTTDTTRIPANCTKHP